MLSKECTKNRPGLVTGQKFLPALAQFVYVIRNSTTRLQKCYIWKKICFFTGRVLVLRACYVQGCQRVFLLASAYDYAVVLKLDIVLYNLLNSPASLNLSGKLPSNSRLPILHATRNQENHVLPTLNKLLPSPKGCVHLLVTQRTESQEISKPNSRTGLASELFSLSRKRAVTPTLEMLREDFSRMHQFLLKFLEFQSSWSLLFGNSLQLSIAPISRTSTSLRAAVK